VSNPADDYSGRWESITIIGRASAAMSGRLASDCRQSFIAGKTDRTYPGHGARTLGIFAPRFPAQDDAANSGNRLVQARRRTV